MPSLNVDLNYFDHPKTMRLVARLGQGSDVLPIRLWAYIGRHHPESGRLALLESEFEHICGWWGEKGKMISAMVEIGFVKREGEFFEINDWMDHSGHLATFKKRAEKAARKRWGIKRKSSNASSIAKHKLKQCPSSAVHSSAVHSITNPLPPHAFETIWARYPRKDGMKAAAKHFKASVETFAHWLDIQKALDNYLGYLRKRKTEPQYIKMGSTWFNNWHDWTNYTEETHGTHERKSVYFSDDHKGGAVRHSQHHSGLRKTPPTAGALLDRIGVKPLPVADRGEEPAE